MSESEMKRLKVQSEARVWTIKNKAVSFDATHSEIYQFAEGPDVGKERVLAIEYSTFLKLKRQLEIAKNCLRNIRGFPMACSESPESQAVMALYEIEKLRGEK